MRLRTLVPVLSVLAALSVGSQIALSRLRPGRSSVVAEGLLAPLGGLRSVAAEAVWFRADRLQEEGRYVELAQLASVLSLLEPHTPEVWSYAAWNLAYNVSVMMPTAQDRWRWVQAAIRLLRDEGLALNPGSSDLCRELAWLFELKIGTDIDSAAPTYRAEWARIVRDVQVRNAWDELKMDPRRMAAIERGTGLTDWTNPQLSALYWASLGNCRDIFEQALSIARRKKNPKAAGTNPGNVKHQ